MRQENNNKEWTSPEIEKLGNANEIVKNVNVRVLETVSSQF